MPFVFNHVGEGVFCWGVGGVLISTSVGSVQVIPTVGSAGEYIVGKLYFVVSMQLKLLLPSVYIVLHF